MYATFSRILRLIAVLFSICATPLYVAVLNYHYELIPSDLLETLILSRAKVPFPPLIEALFLELAIDLLREAGARLPMKVGQTLGIVGGIVIGQASVQAGLTSNILLIIVALSALASFITPIYKMGNAVRLLRFPFLIFAEIGGLFGISLGFIFLFTHLFRLTSLRKPYALFYPTRQQSVKDSWIRFPLTMIDTRDVQARPQHVKKLRKEFQQNIDRILMIKKRGALMSKVQEKYQISPIFVFFLIHGAQFGAGVLGFARIIAKAAGYDGWMGVIITGIFIHILIWMMYVLLKETNGNLVDLHRQTFGKWLGNGISIIFMAYF